MNKTAIDWADMTWNPVTGCYHDCPYCYAKDYAQRFGGHHVMGGEPLDSYGGHNAGDFNGIFEIEEPLKIKTRGKSNNPVQLINAPFPFCFNPTLYRYRLDQPQKMKKPQNIFVCSMADLFGEWVPDEWIEAVFDACAKAPQHTYLFLTKNEKRYQKIMREMPNNMWFGYTHTGIKINNSQVYVHKNWNLFISFEPLLAEIPPFIASYTDWVIIGAETGHRTGKIIPRREWIETILGYCRKGNVPVFMKNNLAPIWGEPLIQEYPWEKG